MVNRVVDLKLLGCAQGGLRIDRVVFYKENAHGLVVGYVWGLAIRHVLDGTPPVLGRCHVPLLDASQVASPRRVDKPVWVSDESTTATQRLQKLFELSFDLMGIASDGFVTTVNPAWTELLGWSAQEISASRYLSFVHEDDLAATRAEMRKLVNGEPSAAFRNRVRHKSGDYRHVEWSLRPVDGVVYMGGRDVSDDVALRHRVERSEAIAVAILHTAADPIVIINTEGEILHVNTATVDLFGYDYESMIGQNVTMLMPEPYRSEHGGYLARYLTEGDPRIIGIGREVVAQKADGSTFPMSLAVSEATTEQDHLFTGIIHDLSERNRQRDELAMANAQLEVRVAERTDQLETVLGEARRSNRDLEQFAYVASHDLQAPLRNVRQGLELLNEHLQETMGESFDDEAEELRGLITDAVTRMEALIKGLLTFSRVQRNPVDDREMVDLGQLVREVARDFTTALAEADGRLVISESLPTLHLNPLQFRQVFQNLIQNAIRYRSADRSLLISVTAAPHGDNTIRLRIEDNGVGIEPAHHERIFELFRRGHSGYDGVGLGLSICRRIVEGHDGRMWVESTAEEGAAFVIELAAIPVDATMA